MGWVTWSATCLVYIYFVLHRHNRTKVSVSRGFELHSHANEFVGIRQVLVRCSIEFAPPICEVSYDFFSASWQSTGSKWRPVEFYRTASRAGSELDGLHCMSIEHSSINTCRSSSLAKMKQFEAVDAYTTTMRFAILIGLAVKFAW